MRGQEKPLDQSTLKGVKMRMTKTMQALLNRAQENASRPNIGVATLAWGTGPQGGRINHGSRELDALHKLVKMGLVEIVKQYTSTIPNAGHTIWVCDTTYRVIPTMPTDEDYLAALGPCNK